jgi:hypothetical protein
VPFLQNVLCEKLRTVPRGKPVAGETLRTELKGSFCARAREAKGRKTRAAADIIEIYDRNMQKTKKLSREERSERGGRRKRSR